MTEIDRIKQEGWLDENFWNPEEKHGFLITTERKEVWAILLDLYKEFARFCCEHNLKFYAIGGTLLGAVRHNGFIPWDDDMDVAMPRKDYEELKKLSKEFKYPYALTWPGIEKENGFSYVKLRNSNTTGTSKVFANLKINHGMDLDIFPIDEANPETYESDYLKIREKLIENSVQMKALSKRREKEPEALNVFNFYKNFEEVEEIAQKDNCKGFDKVAQRTITIYSPDKLLWDKKDFENIIELDFECVKMKVPLGFENILRINYGDWKSFPPKENRGNWHASVIFDPNKSYNYKLS